MPERPLVTMDVEIEFHYDVTRVLDGWSLEEVRDFVEDHDEEGVDILMDNADLMEKDPPWPSFGGTPLEDYLAYREAAAMADERRKQASS